MHSVATQDEEKPNWLLCAIPQGKVVDAAWLTEAGDSASLRSQYVAAGWLERPARGVVQAPAGEITWETVAEVRHAGAVRGRSHPPICTTSNPPNTPKSRPSVVTSRDTPAAR